MVTGQRYLQNERNSHIKAISVGAISNNNTVSPEYFGDATIVVEKDTRNKNIMSFNQLLFNFFGHLRNKPEYLLLYSLVFPLRGVKNDLR